MCGLNPGIEQVTAPRQKFTASMRGQDLVEHLLGVEQVATVNSEDAYGTSGIQDFTSAASRRGLKVLASTSFVNFKEDFSSNVDVLQRSGALVVVLFCQSADATRFIQAMQAAGADNITYVGSEAVTLAVNSMVRSSPEQASRLRGFVGMAQSGGVGDKYTAFKARLSAFQATISGEGCGAATRPTTTAGSCGRRQTEDAPGREATRPSTFTRPMPTTPSMRWHMRSTGHWQPHRTHPSTARCS